MLTNSIISIYFMDPGFFNQLYGQYMDMKPLDFLKKQSCHENGSAESLTGSC